MSLSPSLSSRPPMMMSDPACLLARAGSICAWTSMNLGAVACAPLREWSLVRARRFRVPLVRVATERHLTVGVLEERRRFDHSPFTHHDAATGDHIRGFQRAATECNHIAVAPWSQAPLRRELEHGGGVRGRERKDFLERPPGRDRG